IGFLTIIRINLKKYDNKNAIFYFPLVGLIIATPAYSILSGDIKFKELIALIYMIIITGGLHLDGLADSADAFFSHKDREKKLEIMKDSRIGTFGALSIFILLLSKYEFLKHIDPFAVFVAFSCSRFGAIVIMKSLPYARSKGTGDFFNGFSLYKPELIFLFAPFVVSFFMGLQLFLYLLLFFSLSTFIFIILYKKIIGGWTGDMIGCYIEVMETIILFVAAI
ncbi:MAG: adenosylcobinamide-GDP ribazoletransferase, partial [Calditerrivibrio sp.]|nr:adenosylcobinamide-GDP ribazoletransferase [Calditerrivibrio sp.]